MIVTKKKDASVLLNQIFSVLSSKAKAVKNKSSACALKTRLVISSLLKMSKDVLVVSSSVISNEIHSLLGQHHDHKEDEGYDVGDLINNKAIMLHSAASASASASASEKVVEDGHSDEESELDFEEQQGGSIVDLVRNSKQLEQEEDFKLEDEIDHVADLFIMRFHKQMRMQKLASFKRYQQMIERSA